MCRSVSARRLTMIVHGCWMGLRSVSEAATAAAPSGLGWLGRCCVLFLLAIMAPCSGLPVARYRRQLLGDHPVTSISYKNRHEVNSELPSSGHLPPLTLTSAQSSASPRLLLGNPFTDNCFNSCSLGGGSFCENGGTCIFNDRTCTTHCACPSGLDPERYCSTTLPPAWLSSALDVITTLRPLPERDCYSNARYVCRHGRCVVNATGIGGWMCVCDEGFVGQLCADPCTKFCGVRGACQVDGAGEQYCDCLWPWQGPTCDDQPPEEPDHGWVYWLGGGLAVGMLLLLLVGSLLMTYMWKKRFIVLMKIVHYFQPYEDTDGKLFDAFVSYRSCDPDLEFVYGDLRHKLETEMNFTLCLHERDFLVGEPIANNIIWAIENSRRTILILSPRYLDSAWARMEYQQAQYETLKRKQCIIPIMLEDISIFLDTTDPTLTYILRTVTYLQHPGSAADLRDLDKFWKRLQLSMPKKKDNSTSVSAGDHTTPVVETRHESGGSDHTQPDHIVLTMTAPPEGQS